MKKGFRKKYKKEILYPGCICHVTHRAPGKELLFLEDSDYLRILALIKEISAQYKIDICAFALMSNHIHLLIKTADSELTKPFQKIFERYAIYFNKKYMRKGAVFSSPYGLSVCSDDNYLITVSLYIHLNPVVARLCASPSDYKWSSIELYTSHNKTSFVNPAFVLDILDKNRTKARNNYRELLSEGMKMKLGESLEATHFFKKLKDTTTSFSNITNISLANIDKIIEQYPKYSKVPKLKKARKYLIEQLIAQGFSKTEISKKLNLDRSGIYYTMKV